MPAETKTHGLVFPAALSSNTAFGHLLPDCKMKRAAEIVGEGFQVGPEQRSLHHGGNDWRMGTKCLVAGPCRSNVC